MAEDKKPKIDLKARLGKKTVSAPSASPGAVPPPVGIPKPVGIPAPMFGSQPRAAAPGPKIDASDPYAAISQDAAPKVQEKSIKVEMSEEVVRAQKKGRSRVVFLAGFTALVGAILGWAIGGGMARGESAELALVGARELAKKIDEANAEAEKLSEVLNNAALKLSDQKYPAEEVTALGGLRIPFEGADLVGKGIGRFNEKATGLLLKYASTVSAANDQKDSVAVVLSANKKGIEDHLSQDKDPKVRWSVFLVSGAYGPWAVMQPVPAPFLVKSDATTKDDKGNDKKYSWPESFKIKDGDKDVELKRYSGGDAAREPKFIPIDPSTQALVCPSDLITKLTRELRTMQEVLKGVKGANPDEEKPGLIDLGNAALESLKAIGQPQ